MISTINLWPRTHEASVKTRNRTLTGGKKHEHSRQRKGSRQCGSRNVSLAHDYVGLPSLLTASISEIASKIACVTSKLLGSRHLSRRLGGEWRLSNFQPITTRQRLAIFRRHDQPPPLRVASPPNATCGALPASEANSTREVEYCACAIAIHLPAQKK